MIALLALATAVMSAADGRDQELHSGGVVGFVSSPGRVLVPEFDWGGVSRRDIRPTRPLDTRYR